MSTTWSKNMFELYLKDKKNKGQSLNFSPGLVDTIAKLVLKKSTDNRIVFLKDQDTFCLKSEVKDFADKIEESLRNTGKPCVLPIKSLTDLCKEGLVFIENNTLNLSRKNAALKEFEKNQEEQKEIIKRRQDNN